MPRPEARSDDELMGAYLAGESRAMEALYLRHKAAVYSWLAGMFSPADADDLYQDAWLRIVRSASSFKGSGFKPWLWRITRNLAISAMRKKRPDLWLDEPAGEDGEAPAIDGVADGNAAPANIPVELSEDRARLRAAVAALPARRREILLLRIDAEMTVAEIAETLGMPIGTVLGAMHRAIASLKESLAEKGENCNAR